MYLNSVKNVEQLDEITSTGHIDLIVKGSHFYYYDLSTIVDNDISIEVAELFDNLKDYSDIYNDIDIRLRTKCLIDYINLIKKFNRLGIRFFGKSLIQQYAFMNIPKLEFKIAMIIAYNIEANPQSIQNGKLVVKIPDDFKPTI